MKICLPRIFKKKWGSFTKKVPPEEQTSTEASEDNSKRTKKGSNQRRPSDGEKEKKVTPDQPGQESLMLSVEEMQKSLKTLPKEPGSDASDHVELTEEDIQKRIKVVQEWAKLFNADQFEQSKHYTTDNCLFQFGEPKTTNLALEFNWEEWKEMLHNVANSFPDFKFRYTHVRHVNGVIILQGWRFSGTHTKAPFGFGPFEPIPAKGKYLENDPEESYFYFQPNKHEHFSKVSIYTMGDMTGPQGLYTQIGGFPM
jgi:hypothetical protein